MEAIVDGLAERRTHSEPLLGAGQPNILNVAVASMLAVAAAVHVIVVLAHASEGLVEAEFFAGVAVIQAFLAARIASGLTRRTGLAAIVTGLGLVALWCLSRTVGLPFIGGDVEEVGVLDVVASASEVLSVLAVGMLWVGAGVVRRGVPALLGRGIAAGSFALVLALASFGVLPTHRHGHEKATQTGQRAASEKPKASGDHSEAHTYDRDPHDQR